MFRYIIVFVLVTGIQSVEQSNKSEKAPRVQDQSVRDILTGIAQFFCPANSRWVACFTCEGTCDSPNPRCPTRCQQGRCKCNPGFVRSGQQCISQSACPRTCPANQIFRTCATACEPTCANRNPTCTRQCLSPRCQCNTGFVRQNGECIRPQSCPRQHQNCHSNRGINVLRSASLPVKTSIRSAIPSLVGRQSASVASDSIVNPLLQTPPAFNGSNAGSLAALALLLVPPRLAIETGGDSLCPLNQVFRTCPNLCVPTCARMIPVICDPIFGRPCPPGRCQCSPGFVRNTITNQCISPSSCPLRPPIRIPIRIPIPFPTPFPTPVP